MHRRLIFTLTRIVIAKTLFVQIVLTLLANKVCWATALLRPFQRPIRPSSPLFRQDKHNNVIMDESKHLVLVGGGHAHAQVIKALNKASRPKDLKVTLIDSQKLASYSGE